MSFLSNSFFKPAKNLTPIKSFAFLLVTLLILGSASSTNQNNALDSLIKELNTSSKDDTLKVNLLNKIGYKFWIVDANESIRYGEKALKLSKKLRYNNGLARANRIIGVAYWSQGFQNNALEHLKESYALYKDIEDKAGMANTTLNLGMVYADLHDYEKALKYYDIAINEFTTLQLKGRIATAFTKIGIVLTDQHKETEALKYFTDALKMHIESDFTYGIAEVHSKLGALYINLNEIEQASYHIRKSISIGKRVNDIHGLTYNLINLGKTLRLSNKIDEAILNINKGLSLSKENNLKQFELLAYGELMELKKLQNQPSEALDYYEKFAFLKDSLYDLEQSKQIAYLEFKNELEKKERQLIEAETQKKASNTINLILIVGVIIVSVAGYFIYYVSKERLKKSKQLALKTKEHLESVQALTKKELENAELKQKELQQQLEFKNRELTSYALNFIKKNEVVQELQLTINELKKSDTVQKDKLIANLDKVLKKNLSIDKDWDDFSRFFDDVYQGFYANLKSKHKGLTSNDLKLCSLIRLNLNTKETANILGISPESAKTSRYRLRKKLELDAQQDISNYLVSL